MAELSVRPMPDRPLRRTRVVEVRERGVRHRCDSCKGTGVEHERHLEYDPPEVGSWLRACYVIVGDPIGGRCPNCRGRGFWIEWTEEDGE